MATFPDNLKKAILTPLIKKILLDYEILKIFCLISNLRFIPKSVEKVVAMYVWDYMSATRFYELLQSAYKKLHSTEAALLLVQDALLRALDKHQAAVLVMLDLSALLTLLIIIFWFPP